MYGLFSKNNLVGFWSNNPGDVFLKSTMQMLNLDSTETELFYYAGLESVPEKYEFSADKKLLIKGDVTKTVDDVVVVEEDIINVVEPEAYYSNGIYLKSC